MKRFLLDFLRSAGIYELVTYGGLTLFLALAPLVGYLPYSDRPGPGWYGHFPALGWSAFWGNAGQMAGFGLFFAILALQFALPCAVCVVVADRYLRRRWLSRLIAILLFGAITLYIMPAAGWYISLGAPSIWIGSGLGSLGGFLAAPKQKAPIAAGA